MGIQAELGCLWVRNTYNYTKGEIVALVQQYVDGTTVEHKDLTFGGDMRDLRVSFAKIRRVLGYEPRISVMDGICEIRDVLTSGVIRVRWTISTGMPN